MLSRMEIPQPLRDSVTIFNLFCIKYWFGLLALYGYCKDLVDLLLTVSDDIQSTYHI